MRFVLSFLRAGLALALMSTGAFAQGALTLSVVSDDDKELFVNRLDEGDRWCLHWNHSVTGFLVRDCFIARDGRMVLEKSHQPDFAAGLGHIPGRGIMMTAPEGGYWIEEINEPVPGNCLRLRVGAMAVNHRLVIGDREESLSAVAERQPVRINLRPVGGEGENLC